MKYIDANAWFSLQDKQQISQEYSVSTPVSSTQVKSVDQG